MAARQQTTMEIILKAVNQTQRVYQDVIKQSENTAKSITHRFNTMTTRVMGSLNGLMGMLLRVFSVYALVNFGRSLIKLGGDAVETANLFAVSFGSMTKDMDSFGKELQKISGISDILFRDQSARIFNLFSVLGIAQQEALNMTKDLMSRGLDIGSLFNIDRDEMFDKIRSGLVGMIKPLRPFGINLEISQVEAYAYANGIAEVGTQLTQTQKAMARYRIIMDSTTKAHGDMERTIHMVANASRRLEDMWEQFKITLGTLLQDSLQQVLARLISLVDWLTRAANTLRFVIKQMNDTTRETLGFRVVMNLLIISLQTLLVYLTLNKLQMWLLTPAIKAVLLSKVSLIAVIAALKISIGGLIGSLVALGTTKITLAGITTGFAKAMLALRAVVFTTAQSMLILIFIGIALIRMLNGWAKRENDISRAMLGSSNAADQLAGGIGNVTDNVKALAKAQRWLAPFDEIVSVPDAKGGVIAPDFIVPDFDMTDLLASLDTITNELTDIGEILDFNIVQRLKDSWELTVLIGQEIGKWVTNQVDWIKSRLSDSLELAKLIGSEAKNWATDRINSIKNLFTEARQEAERIKRIVESKISNPFGLGGGFGGGNFGFGGGGGGGRFASGGRPPLDKMSLVGEKGPELFVPDQRGTIISNHDLKSMGGGSDATLNTLISALSQDRTVVLEISGRELAKATFNDFQSEGGRLGKQVNVRRVG